MRASAGSSASVSALGHVADRTPSRVGRVDDVERPTASWISSDAIGSRMKYACVRPCAVRRNTRSPLATAVVPAGTSKRMS